MIHLDGLVTMGTREAWDLRSPDNVYRYAIGRAWDSSDPFAGYRPVFSVIAINPSTARHDVDDPTLRKLVHYAKQEGCGGSLLLRNLAAYSSTDPKELGKVDDPIGPRNADVLGLDPLFAVRVAAWGNFPSKRIRDRLIPSVVTVKSLFGHALHVFGVNQTGEPKHPLYLENATPVVLWRSLP